MRTFRLVLTDISMPEMDGYEVARLIMYTQKNWFEGLKKSGTLMAPKAKKECPVIAVTSYTDRSVYDLATASGIKQEIHKPVTLVLLKSILEKYYFTDQEIIALARLNIEQAAAIVE